MNKYTYQKFLLNCNYEKIKIQDIPCFPDDINQVMDFSEDYCLFDVGNLVIRKIDINYLDEYVDTEEDWQSVLDAFQDVDVIVVYNCDAVYSNPIIQNYREATVKAYLCRLMELNKQIYRARVINTDNKMITLARIG